MTSANTWPAEVFTEAVVVELELVADVDVWDVLTLCAQVEDAVRTRPSRVVVDVRCSTSVVDQVLGILSGVHGALGLGGSRLVLRGCDPEVLRQLASAAAPGRG